MSALLVNGTHLILNGITGSAGDKNGVAKIAVSVNVPDLVTVLTLSPSDVAAALGIGGLICTDRPFHQDPDGEFTINFQMEGFNATWDFAQAQNFMQLSWKPNKSQEPIQTHPNFLGTNGLALTYGYDFDKDKFPTDLTGKNAGRTAFKKGNAADKPTNPLYGVDFWFKYGGTFSRTYAVTTVLADVWHNTGTLIDYPPDAEKIGIPRFSKRKWLKDSPDIDPSGSAWRVSENYVLTGITNGSEAVIYSEDQLKPNA